MKRWKIVGIIFLAISLLILAAYSDQLIKSMTYGSGGKATVASSKKNATSQKNQNKNHKEHKRSSSKNDYESQLKFKKTIIKDKADNQQNIKNKLDKKYRSIYEYFFSSLKDIINQHNLKSSINIEYHIPPFKDNIYNTIDNIHSKYIATVKFNDNNYWRVYLFQIPSLTIEGIPNIVISKSNKAQLKKFGNADIMIIFSPEDNQLAISHNLKDLDLKNIYEFKKSNIILPKAIKTIIDHEVSKHI